MFKIIIILFSFKQVLSLPISIQPRYDNNVSENFEKKMENYDLGIWWLMEYILLREILENF